MRPSKRLAFGLILALCLLAPVTASADDAISAAVFNLQGEDVDNEMVDTLTSIIRNEAQQVEKYQVVNKYALNFEDVLLVLGCSADSPSCLRQAAEQVKARILIFGKVASRDAGYRIELNIFDAQTGRMINRLVRTIDETGDPVISFRKEIEAFFGEQRGTAMTRIRIGSDVEGARIEIEDTFVGKVPLERKGLPPGRYTVVVSADGYEPYREEVELASGADIQVWAPLQATEQDGLAGQTGADTASETTVTTKTSDAEPGVRASGPNWGAWSAITAGGVALVGSGVFAILMENTEATLEEERSAGELTERRYDELVQRGENHELTHRILLGLGAVAVTTGIVWLIIDDGAETESASLELTVSPTGAGARLRW